MKVPLRLVSVCPLRTPLSFWRQAMCRTHARLLMPGLLTVCGREQGRQSLLTPALCLLRLTCTCPGLLACCSAPRLTVSLQSMVVLLRLQSALLSGICTVSSGFGRLAATYSGAACISIWHTHSPATAGGVKRSTTAFNRRMLGSATHRCNATSCPC